MMLLRRSLSAASSPFKQVAAVRSFTARNNDFVEIREHLRALDNCLTELRVGTLSPHVGGLRRANIYHLGKLTGLISAENLAQKNESDSDVKIIEDGGIDVQQLEVMIQDEGVKTRSTIQDEEKKNRLIDAIWKLGNSRTTYYYKERMLVPTIRFPSVRVVLSKIYLISFDQFYEPFWLERSFMLKPMMLVASK